MSYKSNGGTTPAHGSSVTDAITAIGQWSVNHAMATIMLFLVLAGLSVVVTAAKLKVDTNPAHMINKDLPFRKNYFDLSKQFPVLDNSFLIVVDSADPGRGRKVAGEIANVLKRRTDLFSHVFAPGSGAYIDKYGVLYLDEPVVKKLAEDVMQMVPLINTMSLQPDLAGLDDLFRQIVPVAQIGEAPNQLSGFVDKISDSVEGELQRRPSPLNWTSLGNERPTFNETRWYVFVKPIHDFSSVDAAAGPIGEVRQVMSRINGNGSGVKVQLTGEAALNAEEFETVTKGAAIAGALSFTLVTLTVFVGMPSLVLLVPALALIVLGFLINAGFAALSIGYLNMISVAFAVLFIGLGVDYAVHVILRFAEERANGQDGKKAAVAAVKKTCVPLALCTLTTSLAFLAFIPTDFVGMAQLGIIAAGGIVIAFIGSITLVPAILSILPGPQEKIARKFSKLTSVHGRGASQSGSRLRKFASLALIMLAFGCVWLIPQARFDGDPINLKDPAAPSMVAFNDVVEHEPDQTFAIQMLSEPGEAMRNMVAQLTALPEVSKVQTLETVLPADQAAKLAHLNAIADVLPPDIEPAEKMSNEDRLGYLNSILSSVTQIAGAQKATGGLRASAAKLQKTLETFILANGQSGAAVKSLQASLVQGFPELFDAVRRLATLDAATLDNISRDFKDRYVAPDGRWRLEVIPQGDMRDEATRDRFVDAVLGVNPNATGAPVEIKGAADIVASAIRLACLTALGLVVMVLLPVLRRFRDVMLVLVPLVLAGVLMLGYTVAFNSPFNFANVIVVPLLLGLGVDSAIHYVMRAREENVAFDVTGTSTPHAVLISAVTTMGSFGTLWLSAHRGMASMGELLTVAIIITLICTLVVLPQLIVWSTPKG